MPELITGGREEARKEFPEEVKLELRSEGGAGSAN